MKPFRKSILGGLASLGLTASAIGAIGTFGCGAGSDTAPDTAMNPSPPAEPGATTAAEAPSKAGDACPLALPGATSSVEDTVDGVVLVFQTPRRDDRDELRMRVEKLAAVHDSMSAGTGQDPAVSPPASPPQGPAPAAGASSAGSGSKLDATASVEAGEDGIRLVLRPRDPAQLDATRDAMRQRADDLVKNVCKEAGRKTDH
jgi:hypothetical protein